MPWVELCVATTLRQLARRIQLVNHCTSLGSIKLLAIPTIAHTAAAAAATHAGIFKTNTVLLMSGGKKLGSASAARTPAAAPPSDTSRLCKSAT